MHEPLNMHEPVTQATDPATVPAPQVVPGQPDRASLWRVLRDQKKTIAVAVVLVVATYWIAGQFGEWELAGCIAGGVLLGLVNHLMTERWLLGNQGEGSDPVPAKDAWKAV